MDESTVPAPGKTLQLTDVTIEGLRGVGRVELHLEPGQRVYTFFGPNGVGKTKCLEALYQFLLLSNKDFFDYAKHAPFKQSHFVAPVMSAYGCTCDVSKEPSDPDYCFNNNVHPFGSKDAVCLHQLPVVFLGAGRRADLTNSEHSTGTLGSFEERRRKYFDEIRDAVSSSHLTHLGMQGDARDWFVLRTYLSNPHEKYAEIRLAEINAVLSILHEIDPCIDPEYLQTEDGVKVFLKVGGKEPEFGQLSSGFAALVKIAQAIIAGYAAFTNEKQLRNVRGFVLIDEIDSHLHAEWQTRIIPCLKKLLPNTTFFVATHSPLVLSQLQQGEAYSLKRSDDGVVRNRLIEHPGRRSFIDVLEGALDIDLNRLKLDSFDALTEADQKKFKANLTKAKAQLLQLLESQAEA